MKKLVSALTGQVVKRLVRIDRSGVNMREQKSCTETP